ncbi:glutamine-hydrolyzing GMP synthase [Xanthomonas oryzae]|uniref:GMP synthase [glutamine-hydrolyzing] n=3 Tax=Xanthomonas oryzae pv. oryzae TaxID=64187 RepID=GUAA_XANOR|nr:glutamine-hydrolyzing GMP synthase [Xanthomonas oryzae]Q2P3Q9.1 RecName: Full=GMP synthase [glutamine-hydrolyzing]; AltName: Full=GMP synthetase; AltName: Full=Glutamine amidotransferase [Xanthomonas oryzae pv. oryzae MAFF 311018]Q5H0S2.2 RecName: Full=GMP synthase [glutamine-hydrolyzing]; AltName: Full=GMP synthetase; AltName: Full=Glutamine amidotransferase [Xanthomonas oryzae pv. oryzae KACC 10331]AQU45310.1 GMP synthase [Xanthomonas oryzae pv. oryzae]AWK18393.1 GMP synthase (glutamine-hy
MTNIHTDKILILDFGAQYTQLIARRIREIGVYCEIWAWDHDPSEIAGFGAKGIILSGGPESTTLPGAPVAPQEVFDSGLPVFGICYGMQTLAAQLGGATEAADQREFGHAEVDVIAADALFAGLTDHAGAPRLNVWMSHGDHVSQVPPGFTITATTDRIPVAAMSNEDKRWYGVQFHPEVTHTLQGQTLLRRFVVDICGCQTLWTAANIIDDQIARVREQVGDDDVILGLSGGVDSSVVAALLHKAIGDKLTCVFVDTGLLRWQEGDQVMAMFAEHMGVKVIRVNAADRYFAKLEGVSDPEAKRKIIGNLFVEIFDEESNTLANAKWLAQGTIYPDVIESAGSKTGNAHVIKSHHNVGGLPQHMKLGLVEPLRELFKDEVRRLGVELGLPRTMVYRHPFPGPGLGVRILGEVKREYAELLAKADAIFIDELRKADLYDKISQAFAVFLPVKSVGVVGDARAYEWVIALRAVETIDFMTAHWAHLPYDFLGTVSNRIINELRGVSRVVYDISGKPPATIEWE